MIKMTNWLFVSDVDDTLLGDDAALAELMAQLAAHRAHICIAYNSSRPCDSLRQTLATYPTLLTPDYLLGALGTEIQEGPTGETISAYAAHMATGGWDREQIATIAGKFGLTPHAEEFQRRYKASYDVSEGGETAVAYVSNALKAAQLPVRLIYSGGRNLDIIPLTAGKGAVIRFLHQWLSIPAAQVVVAGDSGNDVDMFVPPYRGIVVGNADDDLKAIKGEHIYLAAAHHAAGVLEGLYHWQVL